MTDPHFGFSRRSFLRAAGAGALTMAAPPVFGMEGPGADMNVVSIPRNPEFYIHRKGLFSRDPVGVALIIAIDSSDSIKEEEFRIELEAAAKSFIPKMGPEDSLIESVIRHKAGLKSIAVCVMDFSSRPELRIPWIDLRAEDPNLEERMMGLSDEIMNLSRREWSSTQLAEMLYYNRAVFENCPVPVAERRVLDVFCDGPEGQEPIGPRHRQRDALARMGVTINAFAIVNEQPDIDVYLANNIVTVGFTQANDGITSFPGHVWAVARNMKDYGNRGSVLTEFSGEVERAMKLKISVEIASLDDTEKVLQMANLGDATPQDFLRYLPATICRRNSGLAVPARYNGAPRLSWP